MKNCSHNWGRAFTLVELLVVITIISILAFILFTSLSIAKETARSIACRNNLKQLTLTWNLYVDDNNDRLPGNGYNSCNGRSASSMWVKGYLNPAACVSDSLNLDLLINPSYALFASYLKEKKIYKCPGDRNIISYNIPDENGGNQLRKIDKVRSYSLNWNMGWNRENYIDLTPTEDEIVDKYSQINSPSKALLFLDVYTESICWVWFGIRSNKYVMFPAAYHNKAGSLSYADGHVESKKWKDSRSLDYNKVSFHSHSHNSPNNKDLEWLYERRN